ncbi:GGDEF domain-containing protein [Novosphingobium flavum]|uniref:diguanylate cyclase n=1 Tax=Novosphingobium flavum TaxID=1778672 RepID=A0A7X1KNE7_9SPHN|nr:GGDEF domain-containing protein [Novosphingobium flavum]MBC2667348.1 GGDEF domain-containing protein [Novosphingobium flavum]
MDAHASSPAPRQPRQRWSFRNWLGLAPSPALTAAPTPDDPATGDGDALVAACRLAGREIGEFLALHRLPATHQTLAAAFDSTSGQDPRLAAAIEERRRSGHPVTPDWLASLHAAARPEDEARAMTRLMDKLESNIVEFSRTTVDARTATSEYGQALQIHVDDLHGLATAGAAMTEMVALARTMIERTCVIERQLARSELETRQLHRSLEESRRDAELDHLTGLPNRRAFETRFDREIVTATASGEPLCVAFCDIDRFKRINDTHGHEAGDRVLRAVAHALAALSDDTCHVARHGGEEFVVVLRGRNLAQAYELLDETRSDLAERRMVNRATEVPFGKVSFSAGIADVFAYDDPRAALKAADEALYHAKHEGRNRIAIARGGKVNLPSPKAAQCSRYLLSHAACPNGTFGPENACGPEGCAPAHSPRAA